MRSDKRLVKEIVGAATCLSLANRHLEKIRELAPSMGEQELMNSIAFVMEIIETNAEKGGAPRAEPCSYDGSFDPGA